MQLMSNLSVTTEVNEMIVKAENYTKCNYYLKLMMRKLAEI